MPNKPKKPCSYNRCPNLVELGHFYCKEHRKKNTRQYYIRKGLIDDADKLLPVIKNRVKNYNYYMGRLTEYCDLNDSYHVAEAYLNYMETKPQDIPTQNYMTDRAFYNYFNMGFPIRAHEINYENFKSIRDTFSHLIRKTNWEIGYGSKDSALMICHQLHKKTLHF